VKSGYWKIGFDSNFSFSFQLLFCGPFKRRTCCK
jgi:hypothetical protein